MLPPEEQLEARAQQMQRETRVAGSSERPQLNLALRGSEPVQRHAGSEGPHVFESRIVRPGNAFEYLTGAMVGWLPLR